MIHTNKAHIMVSLQGNSKGETWYKWHMLTIVYRNQSVLEVSYVLVGGWVCWWDNRERYMDGYPKTRKSR